MKKPAKLVRERLVWLEHGFWPVYIGVCTSEKAFRAEMKRLKVAQVDIPAWVSSGFGGSTHHLYKADTHGESLIVCIDIAQLEKLKHPLVAFVGIVTHEMVHVMQEIHTAMNGKDQFDSETSAYGLQWLVQNALYALLTTPP